MVSFFGLKFGDKKRGLKFESSKSKQQQWKKSDQNQLDESQHSSTDIHNKNAINGSMGATTRPGTAHSLRGQKFYDHDTASIAANSMHDLSKMGASNLKYSASEVNIRSRFDDSSTNLSTADSGVESRPGTGSRPGTSQPESRTTAWLNPLDVHFMRDTLAPPKSPLGQFEFGFASDEDPGSDANSLFGSPMEDVVDAVMASINKKESEEKAAKEQERELARQRETARLEQERLERQKATQAKLLLKPRQNLPPPLPPPQTSLPSRPTTKPVLRGKPDLRIATSKDGRLAPKRLNHPQQGSGSIPSPKLSGPNVKTPLPSGPSHMPNGHGKQSALPNSLGAIPNEAGRKPLSPNSLGPGMRQERDAANRRGPLSPGLKSPLSAAWDGSLSPSLDGPSPTRTEISPNGRGTGVPGAGLKNASPASLRSPSESPPRPSTREEAEAYHLPRPVIRNVEAKRDTLTISSSHRESFGLQIGGLGLSHVGDGQGLPSSQTPSVGSSDQALDDEYALRPISPPSPLRFTMSPTSVGVAQPDHPMDTSSPAPLLPTRAKRRPTVDEAHDDPAMIPIPSTPALPGPVVFTFHPQRPSPPDTTNSASLAPHLRGMHFHDPEWAGELSPPKSDSTSICSNNKAEFQFDVPMTPDSANWPLSPISPFNGPASPPTPTGNKQSPRPAVHHYQGLVLQPPAILRPRVPTPLNFSVPTSATQRSLGSATLGDGPGSGPRPDAGIGKKASPLSPALASSEVCSPQERGLGIKEQRDRQMSVGRRPDHGLRTPTGFSDEHGTVFI